MARHLVLVAGLLGACAGPGPSTEREDSARPTDTAEDTEPTEETGDSDTDDTIPPDTGPFDADGDGVVRADDCDDSDPNVHPGATDWCDAKDQDCDGDPIGSGMCGERTDLTSADATPWWLDYPVMTYLQDEWRTSAGTWLVGATEVPESEGSKYLDRAVLVTRDGAGAVPFAEGALWHVPTDYGVYIVMPAGDFDGDGWDDLLASGGTSSGSFANAVFLLTGDASRWPVIDASITENSLGWWIRYTPTDAFGTQVDARADVNGDGLADIVADGAYYDDGATIMRGTVHLMLGRSSAFPQGEMADSEITWWYNLDDEDPWDDGIDTYTFIRDADGDGMDDLIADAWTSEGKHFAFASGATLESTDGADVEDVFTLGDAWDEVNRGETENGKDLGDFDGDGVSDLLTRVSDGDPYEIGPQLAVISGAAIASGAALPDGLLSTVVDPADEAIAGIAFSLTWDLDGDGLLDPVVSCVRDPRGVVFSACVLPTSRFPLGGTAIIDDLGPFYGFPDDNIGPSLAADLDDDWIPELYVTHNEWLKGSEFESAVFTIPEFTIPFEDTTKW